MKIEIRAPGDVINLALDTIHIKKQALVFVNTRQSAEKSAEDISRKIDKKDEGLDRLSAAALRSLSRPTRQCERLALCLKKGIAFHHSGLTSGQKELIEDHFRSGEIKIICCTPTLAAGVDLPAYRAIIRDLRRYGARGLNWIPVLEYLQMCGRAGRPRFDKEGQAIVIAGSEAEKSEVEDRYLHGEPEEIYSKLAVEPVLRTYVLSLIATKFVKTKPQLLQFFEKTFWAFQFKDMKKLENIIDKMLMKLEEWEFIQGSSDDFVSADDLADNRVRATLLGKRVAELYLDPLTAHHLILGLQKAGNRRPSAFALLQMVSYTLEMRPLLRVRTREYDHIQEELAAFEAELLTEEPSMFDEDYNEFMDSVKTTLFFYDWIDEKSEDALLQKFAIRPGEIRMKHDVADWLLYACEELCKLLTFRDVLHEVTKLRFRVRHGAREELLTLLKLKYVGRARARKLFDNKIRNLGEVKKADSTTLAQLLGKKIAASVLTQMGQANEPVNARKRKGQMSVEKY